MKSAEEKQVKPDVRWHLRYFVIAFGYAILPGAVRLLQDQNWHKLQQIMTLILILIFSKLQKYCILLYLVYPKYTLSTLTPVH